MPSITSWTRLEPRARNEEFQTGLQARVHDPLWLLARQWQFGEFTAEDAGSPVMARLNADCARLTRYHPGSLSTDAQSVGQPYDSSRLPLETLVEREAITSEKSQPSLKFSARAGLFFLRLLTAEGMGKYRAKYVNKYAFPGPDDMQQPDTVSADQRFLSVMANRVPHGVQLYIDLQDIPRQPDGTPNSLPEEPAIAAEDLNKVTNAVGKWLHWYEGLYNEPLEDQTSWDSRRMEYTFAVAASNGDHETVLEAPEYTEGHLDWYAFNVHEDASLGSVEDDAGPIGLIRTVIPAPVSYRGMPASRWWEFEDARVDFGNVDAAPEDLVKILFMEFALVYGNDWYMIPIDMPVGSICNINSLVVTDSFGERLLVRHYGEVDPSDSPWRLFSLQSHHDPIVPEPNGKPAADPLFIPPVLATSLKSAPLEEVLLLRDEMANMAWAVERVVQSPAGLKVNRFEALQESRVLNESQPQADTEEPGAPLVYRMTTSVPDYWIPLIPVREKDQGPLNFKRGKLIRSGEEGLFTPQPKGRILEPERELVLPDEEVPRNGAKLTRTYQYSRWLDGATLLWIGRRKRAGRGEGWSGLRFDIVEDV